jgi:tetratricopeptide (TPR) repeat protein
VTPAEPATATTPVGTGPVSWSDAETAFHERRFEEATTLFTAYTEQRPENPWGYYMLGLSEWKAGKAERAVTALEQAVQQDSTHRKAWLNLSRVLLELNRPADALVRGQRALQLDSSAAEAWRILGRAFTDLDSTEQAITAYQRSLALDDADTWSMNNLGLIYIKAGRYEEALRPLARAVELQPERAVFQNNLGLALERTGQFTAATTAYRAALAADTTHVKAGVSLARVEHRTDQEGVAPVDLAAIAREFVEQIAQWKQPATVGVAEPR